MRGGPFRDGKLVVVEDEAEQVRLIFRRYLEVSGINELVRDLKERDVPNQGPLTRLRLGVRYRYYVSRPGLHGEARTAALGSVSRVPAPEIEQAIVSALEAHLAGQGTQID
jgi:hypothetical protein